MVLRRAIGTKWSPRSARAEGDDGGGQRHAGGVEADGVGGGAHGFCADGEAMAVEEGEGGGADEVREGEDGGVGVGAVEEEDGGEREGVSGEGEQEEEERGGWRGRCVGGVLSARSLTRFRFPSRLQVHGRRLVGGYPSGGGETGAGGATDGV